jgi:SSS family solute:Na+ symporter
LKAVVVTETFNTAILLSGILIITILAVIALPQHGVHSFSAFRAAVKPNQLMVLQSSSTVGLNWYAVFLGYPILGIWYWCTDQTIVQRVLGARSEHDARLGPLLAGFLKILPMFLLVLPCDRLCPVSRPDWL